MGLAIGVVTGTAVLVTASILKVLVFRYGMGHSMAGMMTAMYPGYTITYTGAFIASVWTFLKTFILGSLVAWVYNKLL